MTGNTFSSIQPRLCCFPFDARPPVRVVAPCLVEAAHARWQALHLVDVSRRSRHTAAPVETFGPLRVRLHTCARGIRLLRGTSVSWLIELSSRVELVVLVTPPILG